MGKKKIVKIKKPIFVVLSILFLFCFCFLKTTPVKAYSWQEKLQEGFGRVLPNLPGVGLPVKVGMTAAKATEDTFALIAKFILCPINEIFAFILNKSINLFSFAINPDLAEKIFFSSESKKTIREGWTLVRDFLNMFYLLILIFLAIATILRVNRFSDKKLFIFVLFSAFLINFSLPITLVVVDASNLAMSFLFNSTCRVWGEQNNNNNSCSKKIAIGIFNKAKFEAIIKDEIAEKNTVPLLFLETMFLMLAAIFFFFLAITLIIRYLAFWILLVLSPFAIFSFAWPSKSGIGAAWGEWSKKLIHYAAFGPVMLFFIFLTNYLLKVLEEADFTAVGVEGFIAHLISAGAVLYLLFYGYSLSKSIASGAGDAVTKVLDKGQSLAVNSLKTMSLYNKATRYGGAAATGLRQRMADIPYVGTFFKSKEDRDKSANRVRMAFRGNKEEKEKYEAEEASKKAREDKDKGGKDKAAYERDLRQGGEEARVAGLRMAQEGMIKNVGELSQVLGAMKGNSRLQRIVAEQVRDNLRKKAKDGKLNNKADFQNAMAMLSFSGWDKSNTDNSGVIMDIKNEVMRENADIVLNRDSENAQTLRDAALRSGKTEGLERALKSNIALQRVIDNEEARRKTANEKGFENDEEKAKWIRGKYSGDFKKDTYKGFLTGRSTADIVAQKRTQFFDNTEVQSYLRSEYAKNQENLERTVSSVAAGRADDPSTVKAKIYSIIGARGRSSSGSTGSAGGGSGRP